MERDPNHEIMRVLDRLPPAEQETIDECWKTFGPGKPLVVVAPKEDLIKIGIHSPARTRCAKYWFRSDLFQNALDDVLYSIIAHELAHAADALKILKRELPARIEGRVNIFTEAIRNAMKQIGNMEEKNFMEGQSDLRATE